MKNKHIHHLMEIPAILVVFSAIIAHAAVPFAGGTGEPNNPFQIETVQQLLAMGKDPNLLDMHFVLNNDIDMDPNGPNGQIVINSVIGLYENPFFGEFDGNYHVISNLTIQCENDEGCGFIGLLLDIFRGPYLSKNVSSNSVHADQVAGGFIGHLNLDTGRISECCALGEVKANIAGGFAGSAHFSSFPSRSYSLTDCYAANRVSGINEPPNLQDANESTLGGFIAELRTSQRSALEKLQYVSSCFWDKDKTEQSEGIRISNPPSWALDTSQTGVQEKTTEQMMDPNTFIQSGWDYDTIWAQTSGQDYPRLKCLSTDHSSKEANNE